MDRWGKALDQTFAPRDRNWVHAVGLCAEKQELRKRELRNGR
jgi:hypothetical protein